MLSIKPKYFDSGAPVFLGKMKHRWQFRSGHFETARWPNIHGWHPRRTNTSEKLRTQKRYPSVAL